MINEKSCVECGNENCPFPYGIPESLCSNPEREFTTCKLFSFRLEVEKK